MFHCLWTYLFAYELDLGIFGIGLAKSVSDLFQFSLITLFISFDKEMKESWFFPTKETFIGLKEYLVVGIPAMTLIVFELGSFEIITFLSGYLTVDDMGANIIVINTLAFMF